MFFRRSQLERERARALALQQDYTALMVDVARALTSTLDLQSVLSNVMLKMARFFGPERWSLLLVDKKRNDLHYAISVGETAETLNGLRIPIGQGVIGWVAESGNPLIVPDTTVEPRWIDFSRRNPGMLVRSMACMPVRSGDEVIGVIQLLNSKMDFLSDSAIKFLRTISDFSAIAVRNAEDMRRIHELSISDDCTGLFNARHLYTLLAEQFQRSSCEPFCLLFFDLDHFKNVNDTRGHLVGSRLLAEVGALVQAVVGEHNPAFRYGGDEFVVLLPGFAKARGTEMALRLYHALRESRFLRGEGIELRLRGSFGLATCPEDGNGVESIIKAADNMMYYVKGTTRDNVAVAGTGLLFPRRALEGHAEGPDDARVAEAEQESLEALQELQSR